MSKKMTQEEVEQHLKAVVSGEKKLEGLEAVVFNKLRATEQRMAQLHQIAQNAQRQLEQAKAEINAVQGEARGYVDLLVGAENARRGFDENALPAPTPQPSDNDPQVSVKLVAVEVTKDDSKAPPKTVN